ncbi:hypothetical protein SAMN05877753_11139 [Bacillus oleivorans]|uniref:Lipoprotein n=1 Tax=Bacillus oleivorans TaxID=1448271 RepID=A0A285D5S5_9BACI|nr:hypothetical protein [Bacillus oleivorans]SNX75160.1 hypothetical protein SAMN05877753_11139 [Bacillus oleivorans]
MSKSVIHIFFVLLIVLTFTSACSSIIPHNPYTGQQLVIGIIGDAPTQIENERIKFKSLTFDDLIKNDYKKLDAIFIMNDQLAEASKNKYSKIYTDIQIPIIFIGAHNSVPFTTDDIYRGEGDFVKGMPYASGLIQGKGYNLTIYNDIETRDTIELFYSDLFRLIEKND